MHDIDRTQMEFDQEFDSSEFSEELEFSDMEASSPFSEVEEMDLASELLSVTDEGELDQFLGSLIKKASRSVGKFMKSPTGRALGGILRSAARKALPVLGTAAGGFFGGPVGAALGGKLASAAGQAFGLELEGMTDEDAEFEVARRFVRLAGATAANAANAPATASPISVARSAFSAAAQRHAPGMIRSAGAWAGFPSAGSGATGRWIRRGRKIIVLGV